MFQYRKRYALLQLKAFLGFFFSASIVSIPQAVRAVATEKRRDCCQNDQRVKGVSIPQAVRAVATAGSVNPVFMRFQKLVLENLKP